MRLFESLGKPNAKDITPGLDLSSTQRSKFETRGLQNKRFENSLDITSADLDATITRLPDQLLGKAS